MSEGSNVENSAPEQQPEPGEPPRSAAIIPPPPPEMLATAATPDLPPEAPVAEPEPGEGSVPDEQAADSEPEVDSTPAEDAESEVASEPASEDGAGTEPEPEPAPDPEPELEPIVEEEPVRETKPGSMALLKLERVEEDPAYRLRPEGEVDTLATSIARLGQLFPVELRLRPPDRFQIITGFRRIAALRLLKRERVLARVHTDLTDEDALRIALADLLEHQGVPREELVALRERLESEGRLAPTVRDTLDRVLSPADGPLGPEEVTDGEEEVDLDELAQDIARRLASINQDLALVTELWAAMDPSLRRSLLEQLAYPEQLASYLRGL